MATLRNMHRWEELFPDEFMEIIKQTPLVYFPFGLVEEHGTHLTMSTDYAPVYKMCLAAAEITGGIVYPPLLAAPGGSPPLSREDMRARRRGGKPLCPPSLFLSKECCQLIYEETLENMAGIGFKVCLCVGGHGPAITLMHKLTSELDERMDEMKLVNIHWTTLDKSSSAFEDKHTRRLHNAHGGTIETALVRYCDDRLCDVSRIQKTLTAGLGSQMNIFNSDELAEIANNATVELGRAIFDAVVNGMVDAANQAL